MLTLYKLEGKNKEELIEKSLSELNVSENDVYMNIIEEEAKLFKSKKYFIEILKKEDVISFVKKYIKEFSQKINMEINSEVRYNQEILQITLVSDNNSILIGKDGRSLDSIQLLIRNTIYNQTKINVKINLDVAGYKAKKQRNLEYDIKKIAKEVLASHIDVKLDPMNSYERRCVHNVIADFKNLQSISSGEAPNRFITISYKED